MTPFGSKKSRIGLDAFAPGVPGQEVFNTSHLSLAGVPSPDLTAASLRLQDMDRAENAETARDRRRVLFNESGRIV